MKHKTKIPKTPEDWLIEISQAYRDACEAIPFGVLVGQKITHKDIFHLGPATCLKFRGIKQTKGNIEKATEAALTSYVATEEIVGELFETPQMSFAFSYLASHYGLDLADEKMLTELLDYIENNLKKLISLTKQ
jgi:hypothetical protein